MKKVIAFTIIVSAIVIYKAMAVEHVEHQEGAKITFTNDSFDFGDIKEGAVVKTKFEFKNTGNTPLIISQVITSCGCTAPEWPKEPIAPGATGVINVQFDSKHKSGVQRKSITVLSNDIEKHRLIILANVTNQ